MALEAVAARLERIEARLEAWEAEFRDLNAEQRRERTEARGFMDASLVRYGQITDELVGALRALGAEILDGREQIRPNTQAVLRLLDERFGPEPPPA